MSRKAIAAAAAKLRDEISASSFESVWSMMAAAGDQVDMAFEDGNDPVTCWIVGLDYLARRASTPNEYAQRRFAENLQHTRQMVRDNISSNGTTDADT